MCVCVVRVCVCIHENIAVAHLPPVNWCCGLGDCEVVSVSRFFGVCVCSALITCPHTHTHTDATKPHTIFVYYRRNNVTCVRSRNQREQQRQHHNQTNVSHSELCWAIISSAVESRRVVAVVVVVVVVGASTKIQFAYNSPIYPVSHAETQRKSVVIGCFVLFFVVVFDVAWV